MAIAMLRELFEPYPELLHPKPWRLYERLGRELLQSWKRVSKNILENGNAEGLHEVRDEYERILLAHLKILEGYLSLLSSFKEFNGNHHHIRDVERTRIELSAHYDKLFPRWKTLEDLEEILLAPFMLSNEVLKALAAKSTFPQAWYDDDSNPFEPETEEQSH